jgi:DNA replication protein DnaC
MNPMLPLEPLLKQLRLSGILDSLEARNRQAIEAKLAYTDFLALLVEDEVARRDQRQFAQRLRKAQVVGDKTLERFDLQPQNPVTQSRADCRVWRPVASSSNMHRF